MNSRFMAICILLGLFLAGPAYAYRTVIILNDLFIDFSVASNTPYWINDSQIVHNMGRVNYEDDGRYILTNAVTYYDILNKAYRNTLLRAWGKFVGTDFDTNVIQYYNQREQINISGDLDLQEYWYHRKHEVFGYKAK